MDRLANALKWTPEKGERLLCLFQKLWRVTEEYVYPWNIRMRSPAVIAFGRVLGRFKNVMARRGMFESVPFLELLGCSPEELGRYLEGKFKFGMKWENAFMWHIDHIRPCASYDLFRIEQQKACFHYSNLQPLWKRENLHKSAKYNASTP